MANDQKPPKLPTPLMTILGIGAAPSLLVQATTFTAHVAAELEDRTTKIGQLVDEVRQAKGRADEREKDVVLLREKIRELEGLLAKPRAEGPTKSERELAQLASARFQKLQRVATELDALATRFEGGASYEALCQAMRRIARDAVTDAPGTVDAHVQAARPSNGQEKG